jgi:serine/threonine protein kinase
LGAHERLSPDNLFVCDNGTVKILNFWFALSCYLPHLPFDPVYTAPEQHLDSYPVDRRCDCYSLGAVLFRMLCGRPPIELQGGADWLMSPADFKQKFMSTPKPTPDDGVSPALVSVLTRMMAPRPEDRYPSMTEVIAALRPFVEPESTGDYPEMAAAALAQPA